MASTVAYFIIFTFFVEPNVFGRELDCGKPTGGLILCLNANRYGDSRSRRNTLSEQNKCRCSEANTVADGDKRVNEFGDGCGHASTMCRPVLACVRKNFFTSPLCTTVCVCEKTLRLFEQTIHFEMTVAPHLCPLCMSVYAHKL